MYVVEQNIKMSKANTDNISEIEPKKANAKMLTRVWTHSCTTITLYARENSVSVTEASPLKLSQQHSGKHTLLLWGQVRAKEEDVWKKWQVRYSAQMYKHLEEWTYFLSNTLSGSLPSALRREMLLTRLKELFTSSWEQTHKRVGHTHMFTHLHKPEHLFAVASLNTGHILVLSGDRDW